MTKPSKEIWEKTDKHQWTLYIGENDIEIYRERPSRWHANGVGGLVEDRDKPYRWVAVVTIGGAHDHAPELIPDGSSVTIAKRIAAKHFRKKIALAQAPSLNPPS